MVSPILNWLKYAPICFIIFLMKPHIQCKTQQKTKIEELSVGICVLNMWKNIYMGKNMHMNQHIRKKNSSSKKFHPRAYGSNYNI